MMKYDTIQKKLYKDVAYIEYGIVNGNNTIVFIKVGQDGSIFGYQNKYLDIAFELNRKHGYTVIVSSNPFDGSNPLDFDLENISEYCKKNSIKNYRIFFMGHSNGAKIGNIWGYKYKKIKKMLLINSPIFINWLNQKEGLKQIIDKDVLIVYGDKDQSYRYVELYNPLLNNQIKLKVVNNADHDFTGLLSEFKNLAYDFFKED